MRAWRAAKRANHALKRWVAGHRIIAAAVTYLLGFAILLAAMALTGDVRPAGAALIAVGPALGVAVKPFAQRVMSPDAEQHPLPQRANRTDRPASRRRSPS